MCIIWLLLCVCVFLGGQPQITASELLDVGLPFGALRQNKPALILLLAFQREANGIAQNNNW